MRNTAIALLTATSMFAVSSQAYVMVDFEDKTLSPGTYYNGFDGNDGATGVPVSNTNGWVSRGTKFANDYYEPYGSWSGWSYSNVNDTTTAGYTNQYAAFTGTGAGGSGNYAVGFYDSYGTNNYINLSGSDRVQSIDITNTTYAALSMRDGDGFAKKFGGITGNDQDYFKVTFTGYDDLNGTGGVTGTIEAYLADFRFDDNSQDYILGTWETIDLTGLGAAKSITFMLSSTDNGDFGMNTPAYLAIDNLLVPEPASIGLLMSAGLFVTRRRRQIA